jgi:hypothetical protein
MAEITTNPCCKDLVVTGSSLARVENQKEINTFPSDKKVKNRVIG